MVGFITRFMNSFGQNAYNNIQLHTTAQPRESVKRERGYSEFLNALDSNIEETVALQIFCSRYRWGGEVIELFPHGFIERSLAYTGIAVMIKKGGAYQVFPAQVSQFNDMWIPNKFTLLGNRTANEYSINNCVPIYDNPLFISPYVLLQRYSDIVADMGRTVEIYVKGMKTPTIIETDSKNAFTDKAIAEQKLKNWPYLLIRRRKEKRMNEEPSQFFNTNHKADDLQGIIMARKTMFSEMCSKIGVTSSHLQKSQYKSDGEIAEENTVSNSLLHQGLEMRKKSTKDMKEIFNIDVTCDLSEALEPLVEEYNNNLEEQPQMQEKDRS